MLRCPKCKKTDQIHINALVTVRVTQDEENDNIETETVDAEHEWDDDSRAFRKACDFAGKVLKFRKASRRSE